MVDNRLLRLLGDSWRSLLFLGTVGDLESCSGYIEQRTLQLWGRYYTLLSLFLPGKCSQQAWFTLPRHTSVTLPCTLVPSPLLCYKPVLFLLFLFSALLWPLTVVTGTDPWHHKMKKRIGGSLQHTSKGFRRLGFDNHWWKRISPQPSHSHSHAAFVRTMSINEDLAKISLSFHGSYLSLVDHLHESETQAAFLTRHRWLEAIPTLLSTERQIWPGLPLQSHTQTAVAVQQNPEFYFHTLDGLGSSEPHHA